MKARTVGAQILTKSWRYEQRAAPRAWGRCSPQWWSWCMWGAALSERSRMWGWLQCTTSANLGAPLARLALAFLPHRRYVPAMKARESQNGSSACSIASHSPCPHTRCHEQEPHSLKDCYCNVCAHSHTQFSCTPNTNPQSQPGWRFPQSLSSPIFLHSLIGKIRVYCPASSASHVSSWLRRR
jgi:hypothetical protein